MIIDTDLVVVGRGPAALVVTKIAARHRLPCLLVGHEIIGDDTPVALSAEAVAALERQRLVDVLRPYVTNVDPLTITPRAFEDVLKSHCVADLNATVYDQMEVVDRVEDGQGVQAVLTDGTTRWTLRTDALVDASQLPGELSSAIVAGEAAVRRVLAQT